MDILNRIRRSATIALILSPTGLLILGIVRLLIISNYNQTTAIAIVSSGGYVNTLLGTIIPIAPIILPYLALILLFFRRIAPGLIALIASALISPTVASARAEYYWHLLVTWLEAHFVTASLLGTIIIILIIVSSLRGFARTTGVIASIALVPYVISIYPLPYANTFYSDQIRRPWLPPEVVTLETHHRVVGYTLSSDSDWLVFLNDRTRQVAYYPSEEISKRSLCQIYSPNAIKPLLTFTPTYPSPPICPELNSPASGPEMKSTWRECSPAPTPTGAVSQHATPGAPSFRCYILRA